MTPCDIEAAIDYAAGIVGVKTLKPQQREALLSFALGKDVFVSLPTGFGKSFCYVLLPPVFDHLRRCEETSIVLCISPLTALMMEQRAKFSLRGVRTDFIGQLQQDIQAMSTVQKGQVQLLYSSPESILCNPQWRDMLQLEVYQRNLVAIVVDEAHCITMWLVIQYNYSA